MLVTDMRMPVILESPYKGDVARNETYAKRCMRDSLDRGEAPFVSHMLYTRVLDDTNPDERLMGMKAGFSWIAPSTKTVVYTDYGISEGMREGISLATILLHGVEFREIGKNQDK